MRRRSNGQRRSGVGLLDDLKLPVRRMMMLAPRAALLTVLVALALPGSGQAALSWSGPIQVSPTVPFGAAGFACPSISQCTLIDQATQAVTFTPSSSAGGTPFPIDPGHGVTGVSCPSALQCTAVDDAGGEITFDPLAPAHLRRAVVARTGFVSVSCPLDSQCTAVGGAGDAVTFDPTDPTSHSRMTIGSGISKLACPSASQCTATDLAGHEITFDPVSAGSPTVALVDASGPLVDLACPSTSQCTGVDYSGSSQAVREVTFNPKAPGTPVPVAVDSGSASTGPPAESGPIACPSVSLCVVTDFDHSQVMGGNVREVSFDPASPGTPTPVVISGTFKFFGVITHLSCPSIGVCVGITESGSELDFNPSSPAMAASPLNINTLRAPVVGLACPTSSRCTGVSGLSSYFVPPTLVFESFNPLRPKHVSTLKLLSGTPDAVACPSRTRCVAVTHGGTEATMNPDSAKQPKLDRISRRPLTSLACPSVRQCTTVDDHGNEVTFNPAAPHRTSRSRIDGDGHLTAISCPSRTQCTTADTSGREVTFDPGAPSHRSSRRIDASNALSALSCPSTTECVAIDRTGGAVTFNPRSNHVPGRHEIDHPGGLTAIACPSKGHCIAVDRYGRAIAGDPHSPGSWKIKPISGANSLLSIACNSKFRCVAADTNGRAFVRH